MVGLATIDDLVHLYNDKFAKPIAAIMGELKKDGLITKSPFDEQIEWCWRNIVSVLEASDMGIEDLVKVTTFMTDRSQREKNAEVRGRFLGDTRPAQTLLFVSGLTLPPYLCEVEAIAAKAL